MAHISQDILTYLQQLSLHNERDRFHDPENQDRYQRIRKEFVHFVEELRDSIADRYESGLAELESKQMIFRINRDVRFSKDKSPYKNNLGASLTKKGGKKSPYAGRYLHIQPGNHSFIGGGLYYPPKESVEVVRDKFERDGKEFTKIVSQKKFVEHFERVLGRELKTHPRNRSAETPHLQRVKKKERYVLREFKDSEVVKKNFMEVCLSAAECLTPFNAFLNDGIDDLFI